MNYLEPTNKLDLTNLLSQLVAFHSITPEDAGCQGFMKQWLEAIGFTCHSYDSGPVANFFACYGSEGPLLVFAGHTDVVPVGDSTNWTSPPFQLIERDGMLYGRGTADMKGSLACMMLAAARFIAHHPKFHGRLGFLITSGEEGDDFDYGTPYVMEELHKQSVKIDYCVVGEPSSVSAIGDTIKVGRRGSLSASIHLQGKQGHVAYPHLASNPIHSISPILVALTAKQWDQGNAYFQPTSLQITGLQSGGHAGNVIPGDLRLQLNFRYSTEQDDAQLKASVEQLFADNKLNPTIQWRLNGKPFLTEKGLLVEVAQQVILEQTGLTTELSTSGGTSDARFIAPYGVQVIELGPVNATIHQVNECVSLAELEILEKMYLGLMERLLPSV